MEKNYTVKEVSDLFGVHDRTVRRWIDSGKIKSFRIGRTIRITESEIRKVVEGK